MRLLAIAVVLIAVGLAAIALVGDVAGGVVGGIAGGAAPVAVRRGDRPRARLRLLDRAARSLSQTLRHRRSLVPL